MKTVVDFDNYFFVIDSDNLNSIENDLYGFVIQSDGIYDRTNLHLLDSSKLEGCGTYILIEKNENGITLKQDACGNFGIYIYQKDGYFALSNSFFKLFNYIKDNHKMTLNKDFCNNYLTTWITSLSYEHTALNEISVVPSHAIVKISNEGKVEYEYIDYKYNSISLDSPEGIKLLDEWYIKWVGIIRGILKNTKHVCIDLSGGFDSRLVFSFVLNTGLDLNEYYIRSLNDKKHTHSEDFEIANIFADKYNFTINNYQIADYKSVGMSEDEVVQLSYYVKMLAEKELTFPNLLFDKQLFWFGGFGGELIRPYWDMHPSELIKKEVNRLYKYPYGLFCEFKDSATKVLDETYQKIGEKYGLTDKDSSMFTFNTFKECYSRNHFGKIAVEAYICNALKMSPSMDPLVHRLKMDTEDCRDKNLLTALVFERFRKDVLDIKFDGGRSFNEETLRVAQQINKKYPFKDRDIFTKDQKFNFERNTVTYDSGYPEIPGEVSEKKIYKKFKDKELEKTFTKYFPQELYDFADKFYNRMQYFPSRYIGGVLPIEQVMEGIISYNKTHSHIDDISDYEEIFGISPQVDKNGNRLDIDKTARIDILGTDYELVSLSDSEAYVYKPDWFQKNGDGYVIESNSGYLDITLKSHVMEKLMIKFKGVDYKEDGKKVPKWIGYKKIMINGETILDSEKYVWHDRPIVKYMDVYGDEMIYIHIEWKVSNDR